VSAAPVPPQLSPEQKRELLKRLLAAKAAAPSDSPLSPGQKALWFLHKFLPDTAAYHVAFAGRLRPRLELVAFRRALDALVARHPGLRTVFPARDGEPVQRVLPPTSAPFRVVELEDQSEEALNEALTAEYRRPFRLDESLVSVTVYRGLQEDVLLVNVHHIVYDAGSVQTFFAELRALYAAELRGARAELPPLAARYGDFVAWQNEVIGGARGEQLWRYWESVLGDGPPPLAIAAAQPRPPVLALRGAGLPLVVAPPVAAGLRALAKGEHTTLYTVLLAAMQLLLYAFSGQPDITVGTPVSLRARREWMGVIGYFINMLPVRGRVGVDSSFTEHLTRVRTAVLGALAHQEFPFPSLVDRLRVRREPNRSAIFQAVLNVMVSPRGSELSRLFHPGARDAVEFGGSQLSLLAFPQQEGQFEIVIELVDSGDALHGNFKYHTDLYSPDLARLMRDAYTALLAAVVADPHARVADLIAPAREEFEL
jgi:hypothetical protein